MVDSNPAVTIIGAGLLVVRLRSTADRGIPVKLHEMKPERRTAQHSDSLAELVCSNSFSECEYCQCDWLTQVGNAAHGQLHHGCC